MEVLVLVSVIVATVAGIVQIVDWAQKRRQRRRREKPVASGRAETKLAKRPEGWADESEDWRHELLSSGVASDDAPGTLEIVMGSARSAELEDVLSAWYKHLRRRLVFPFEVRRRVENEESGSSLTARRLIGVRNGMVVVQVAGGEAVEELPLEALVVPDPLSPNREFVEDYARWRLELK